MTLLTAPTEPAAAAEALDAHVHAIWRFHTDPATGTPHWQDLARDLALGPDAIRTFADLAQLPRFDTTLLKTLPHERFTPLALAARPPAIFETGGTTGPPAQRLSWADHLTDYEAFSKLLSDTDFPRGAPWLMLGPTGPRRLRLSIEHLANHRGGPCYHVDLDARWVKALLAQGRPDEARAYKDHVVAQGLRILRQRKITCLFTTPKLLEALGEHLSLADHGITGVFLGGTSMTPQTLRFLVEETLEGRVALLPTYGNTLMGLASSAPLTPDNGYQLTYYAPQPRAVLRVVDPDAPDRLVDYDAWGRVELSTLTRECFIPRLLERDEAIRRRPTERFPWDGAGEVRPFRALDAPVVEGVY